MVLVVSNQILEIGPLVMDRNNYFLPYLGRKRLILPAAQVRILWALAENYPQTVSRKELWKSYRSQEPLASDLCLTLKVHIYQIRKHLRESGGGVKIVNDRGKGYSLQLDQPQREQNGH